MDLDAVKTGLAQVGAGAAECLDHAFDLGKGHFMRYLRVVARHRDRRGTPGGPVRIAQRDAPAMEYLADYCGALAVHFIGQSGERRQGFPIERFVIAAAAHRAVDMHRRPTGDDESDAAARARAIKRVITFRGLSFLCKPAAHRQHDDAVAQC